MALSLELPKLWVEGLTDLHTVVQLLARHGIILDKDVGPVIVKEVQGAQELLGLVNTAAKASTHRPVGFIIDADDSVKLRWQAVCDRLGAIGLSLPQVIPNDGYVGDSSATKSKVGVWIMPDNQRDAAQLEDLVTTLVPTEDTLFPHARSATDHAISLGAKFGMQHRTKAHLHCWLAWQAEPGRPFGTALKAHFLRHDSDVANAFVAWFRRLFDITST